MNQLVWVLLSYDKVEMSWVLFSPYQIVITDKAGIIESVKKHQSRCSFIEK